MSEPAAGVANVGGTGTSTGSGSGETLTGEVGKGKGEQLLKVLVVLLCVLSIIFLTIGILSIMGLRSLFSDDNWCKQGGGEISESSLMWSVGISFSCSIGVILIGILHWGRTDLQKKGQLMRLGVSFGLVLIMSIIIISCASTALMRGTLTKSVRYWNGVVVGLSVFAVILTIVVGISSIVYYSKYGKYRSEEEIIRGVIEEPPRNPAPAPGAVTT